MAQFRAFVEDSGHDPEDSDSLQGEANHPMVNVTWHDALAYCRWLTDTLHHWEQTPEPLARLLREQGWQITLPSEAQWEKAARGDDGREFPWGEKADPNCANYGETRIGATSPVGCFPAGASPYGILDMSGNVWERTRSLWGKDWGTPDFRYPYDAADGRENLNAERDFARELRGGAFYNYFGSLRCAHRFGDLPINWYWLLGFRVVLSPV